MNLTDPASLKALLERHGMRPQKHWGQHFLVSSNVVDAIVARLDGVRGVLEIGPGPGVLTSRLCAVVEKVAAVEIDAIAVSALAETAPCAMVLREDALVADLGLILRGLPPPCAIVSNMPYNITGPLLGRIAELSSSFVKAVLMMQKEVGVRILAEAGDSDRGSLSVWLQSLFTITRVKNVPAGAFFPPPKVSSVVLEFVPRVSPLLNVDTLRIVRAGFTQPRKTLVNNLRAIGLSEAVEGAGLDKKIRPHQLTIEQWRKLSLSTSHG